MSNTFFSSILSGIVSGIIASICFAEILFLIKPKVKVSNFICFSKNVDGTLTYKIKIVNKSRFMLTNINYSLRYIKTQGKDRASATEIAPINSTIINIDGFSRSHKKQKVHYSIRLTYNINPIECELNDSSRFEFIFTANHSLSNAPICVKRQYYHYDIIEGIFEKDDSVNILCTNN